MAEILVVTGASRGIGAATARLAGARGAKVAVNYNSNAAKADEVVKAIRAAGGTAVAIQGDVSTEEGANHLFAETDRQLGRVTQLFNNAGVVHRYKTITEFTAAELNQLWQTNMTSQFLCAREAVKRMSTKLGGKGGTIVNMSSAASYIGGANGMIAYAVSKGAMDTFTRGLAIECAPQGIRVNAVRPGVIETDIHADTGDNDRIGKLTPQIPMLRSGKAEEVAEAVLFLLGPASSYVTDSLIDVSGGR